MCQMSGVQCHMSGVMCQVSGVTCKVSGVMFFLVLFFYKVMKLFGGGSVINGAYPD